MNSLFKRYRKISIAILLGIVTFAAYLPVLKNDFITYDDGSYVTENPAVLSGITGSSVMWAFNVGYSGNWHPLTWLSHMLDVMLFGVNPAGHHLMNLLLHIANSVLLFFLLQRMTKAVWPSAFVAVVFALHPLHVQSVAWASERKDVLSTLFWLITMWAYARYAERRKTAQYIVALACFALGLMAKPMLVTMPFVLLLMDFWPLGRTKFYVIPEPSGKKRGNAQQPTSGGLSVIALVKEKIPFFALAIVSSIITFIAQKQGGAVAATSVLSLDHRITNALVSYIAYISKTIWPANLAFFYPHPAEHLPAWQAVVAGLTLVVLTAVVIKYARRLPYAAFGWLWYLATLVPVIGIVQVGLQAMADRYMYVPMIGFAVIVAWGLPTLLRLNKNVIAVGIIASSLAMGAATYVQAGYWRDSRTLYERAINVTDHNWVAHTNLAVAISREGRIDDAIAQYNMALQIKPDYVEAHRLLAFHLANKGQTNEAIAHFREALRINPNDPEAHNNLGSLLARQGKTSEAISEYREAIRSNPDYAEAHFNLGFFLSQQGNAAEAVQHYSEAVRIKPDYADARLNLGNLLVAQGKTEEGMAQYVQLTRNNPNYEKGYLALGLQLTAQGKLNEAVAQYTAALRINPNYVEARSELSRVQQMLGQRPQ